jgi:hypothetical protein
VSVCCDCCVLSGRGLCDELIARPVESYRLVCRMWSRKNKPREWGQDPLGGYRAKKRNVQVSKFWCYATNWEQIGPSRKAFLILLCKDVYIILCTKKEFDFTFLGALFRYSLRRT